MPNPSLDAFELAAARREHEAALLECLHILKSIDDRYGRLDMIQVSLGGDKQRLERLATRFAAAFGQVICDPTTDLTPILYEQLTTHHRWIELMYSVGGFGSSDFLVPLLATGEASARRVPPENLRRFLLLFSAAAGMDMNLEECLHADAAGAASALLGYLGTRFCFTEPAHAFRERLLEWLPGRLGGVKLGVVVLQTIASPYMHCSYAMTPRKHDIKADLIAQMRRGCLEAGCPEYDPARPPPKSERPTIVVSTEHFPEGHSVHRTHSRVVKALKQSFHVVGLAYQRHITAPVEACFDEIVFYPEGPFMPGVRALVDQVMARRPAMVLHLGVGMSPHVIALASLRLAPVQAVSFGHTATTRSPVIDYMILPEDFVGDRSCFSEEVVGLPPAAMPYEPRRDTDFAAAREAAAAAKAARTDGVVRIAVAASAMKLGPPVFNALARVAAEARTPVEFQVFPLGCAGLGYAELKRRLAEQLPSAVVNEELPYGPYIEKLAACDFFVCPFPYGNMNSIIDAVLVGLPGVCLDGAEAHAHADAAYFKRMGFPKGLTTKSVGDYVAAIVKLADDPKWLARCRKAAAAADLETAFFAGEEQLFVAAMHDLIARHATAPTELEAVS